MIFDYFDERAHRLDGNKFIGKLKRGWRIMNGEWIWWREAPLKLCACTGTRRFHWGSCCVVVRGIWPRWRIVDLWDNLVDIEVGDNTFYKYWSTLLTPLVLMERTLCDPFMPVVDVFVAPRTKDFTRAFGSIASFQRQDIFSWIWGGRKQWTFITYDMRT